jgi:hypothetical protein
MQWRRLNIGLIERRLRALLAETVEAETWERLHEEPLTEDATRRLFEGYRAVDALLAERIDIFAYGESERILELNHMVLCGPSPDRRVQYASHITATRRYFYDDPRGGVAALMDRYGRSRRHAPEVMAAEIYAQAVTAPQLFLEGNSRTASLLASYCLARAGQPPLVVTNATLREYHQIAQRCAALDRDGITGMIGFGLSVRRIAHFLRESRDPEFLRPADMPATPGGV